MIGGSIGVVRDLGVLGEFELYQVFMRYFIGKNVRIFSLFVLLIRTTNTFWSKGFITFGLELSGNLEPKVSYKKADKIPMVFQLYQVLIHNFLTQNILIPPNHLLLTCSKSIFTTSHQILC